MLDHKYERQLIEDYLLMFPGQKFNAISTIQSMRERWGIQIDWHEASTVLGQMCDRGDAIVVEYTAGRMIEYVVEEPGPSLGRRA